MLHLIKKAQKGYDKDFRIMAYSEKDGTVVSLEIFKEGYIHYGRLYFKMNEETFSKLWTQLLDRK